MDDLKQKLEQIQLLVLDVDGVLTDGKIIIDENGIELKHFHVSDGHRIRMWQRSGRKTAILSGRTSGATTQRARQLEIDEVLQGCHQKLPAWETLLEKLNLKPEQTAYIGDDLMDIPLVRRAGLGAAVANASPELIPYADYITQTPGGGGAVGEVIEWILKQTGQWDKLMERYLV